GLIALSLTTQAFMLQPKGCGRIGELCDAHSLAETTMFYLSIYLIALGNGGAEPVLETVGADQFDEEDPEEKQAKTTFLSYFYVALSSLISETILVYIETIGEYAVAFWISTLCAFIALFTVVNGTFRYRNFKPLGNPISRFAQVLVASIRKIKLQVPSNGDGLYEDYLRDDIGTRRIYHTSEFKQVLLFLDHASIKTPDDSENLNPWRLCTITQVKELATENFDESLVIGRGGFGKVYRGTIFNESATVLAAIKRLDPNSNQGAPKFWAEVEMLSKLRHCNLVSLFGYCNEEKEMILVYEYMPNGTLEDHLHKLGTPLSWVQRLNICIGACRGLHYLHTGTGIDVGVIHRDVKTSNIFLQESWAAKISDFGLSKIGPTNQPMTYVNTLVKGTFGYFDPDYYATGNLTRKSDVYAFGVVLLEVLCRKRAIFNIDGEALNLANWAQESIKEGSVKNIIDFDIRGQISPKCSKEFVRITERCLHSSPKQRPTMAEVLFSLESILILQEKFNNSVQPAGRTILDRMVNMLPFPSNRDNTGILSSS
ncbi:receptor-like protein kinase FERONIA, partial [Tanacetum coccineum]